MTQHTFDNRNLPLMLAGADGRAPGDGSCWVGGMMVPRPSPHDRGALRDGASPAPRRLLVSRGGGLGGVTLHHPCIAGDWWLLFIPVNKGETNLLDWK